MSNVISKAALLEWLSRGDVLAYENLPRIVRSGKFDIPTDKKRCHLCPDDAETCYCYDDKPSVDADAKEIKGGQPE